VNDLNAVLPTFSIEDVYDDLGPFLFLQAHAARGDHHLVKRDLKRAVDPSVLPERATISRTISSGPVTDVMAQVDDTLVLLRTWKAAADVWVTASDAAVAAGVADEVLQRVAPVRRPNRVDARFTSFDGGTRWGDLEVRPWDAVATTYPRAVRDALDVVMAHRHAVEDASRLLLWHGEPGTGKTTAIRALLHAWRDWAEGVVVTDPDELLGSAKYLRSALLDAVDEDRWQLFVLEDAESLLRKGSGKGLAKLLNLCDGLLGQGLRCLFLITTNEPLNTLHPAITRPGRCLSRIEFGKLGSAEAAHLLGRPVEGDMTLAEVMAAKPVTVVQAPVAVGQYL
jgi:hypothetical protein